MFCSFVNWSIWTFFSQHTFLKHVKPGWVMLPKHWNHFAHIKISQDDSLEGSLVLYWRWPISGPKMAPLFSAEWLNQGNSLSDALKPVRRGGALNFHDAIDMIGAAFWEAIIMKWVRRTKGLHVGVVWKLGTAKSHGEWSFPSLKLPFWGVYTFSDTPIEDGLAKAGFPRKKIMHVINIWYPWSSQY